MASLPPRTPIPNRPIIMKIRLSNRILKIHFIKAGSVIGAVWRKGWRPMHRGNIMDKQTSAKLFYCDGRTEIVPQGRRIPN